MSELDIPESWAETIVREVCQIGDGNHSGKYPKSSEMVERGVPFIRAGNLVGGSVSDLDMKFISKSKHEELRKGHLRAGDILFSNRGEIGKVAVVPEKYDGANLNSQLAWLRFEGGPILNKFAYHYLCSPLIVSYTGRTKQGSALQQYTIKQLGDLPILVPPMDEQKRIVQKIESTSKKIEVIEQSVERAEKLLGKYRESLLAKAFRGELVPQNPNDEPASMLLEQIRAERAKQQDSKKKKKDELPPIADDEIPFEIPKSWEWVRSSEIFDVRDGTHDSPKAKNSGVPLVTSKNLKNGVIDFSSCSYISESDHRNIAKRSKVERGDLIMAMIGTIGNPVVVDTDDEFSIKNVALFKPIEAVPNLSLLRYFLDSPLFEKLLGEKKQGTTQKFLSLGTLRTFLFPLPPVAEQVRIIAAVQEMIGVDGLFEVIGASQALIENLKSSVLNKAFCGGLVSQIASEGTGHDLLAEIIAQHRNDKTSSSEAKSKKKGKK